MANELVRKGRKRGRKAHRANSRERENDERRESQREIIGTKEEANIRGERKGVEKGSL